MQLLRFIDNWTGSAVCGDLIAAGMTMPDWVKEFLAGDRVKYIK